MADQHSMWRTRTTFRSEIDMAFEELGAIYEQQKELYDDLRKEQSRGRKVLQRLEELPWRDIDEKLARAEKLIKKKGYMVAMLGTFSAGKSSLANALLKEPGFLPASQGVCTLTVAEIRGTTDVSKEKVIVKYLPKEGTFRKVFGSDLFSNTLKAHLNELDPFNEERARDWVNEAIEFYKKATDEDQKEKAIRLTRFLEALVTYAGKLGKTIEDIMENKDLYLSAQGKDGEGDLNEGHLFLIDKVQLVKVNDILNADDIVFMDLPGVDAPSVRDKEVTFDAIEEADAAVWVIPERGFAAPDKELIQRVSNFQEDVKSKIFVAVNKTDTLNPEQINRFESEFFPSFEETVHTMGVELNKIFFTSAYYEEQNLHLEKGHMNAKQKNDFETWKADLKNKLALIKERIQTPSIRERLEPVFENSGVSVLSDALQNYLREDIRKDRVREIYFRLRDVQKQFDWMLDPERGKIEASTKLRAQRIGEYFYDTTDKFESLVNTFCADILPDRIETSIEKFLREKAADFAKKGIEENLFGADGRKFANIVMQAQPKTAGIVKLIALTSIKPILVEFYKKIVRETLPNPIITEFKGKLEEMQFEDIFRHFSEQFIVGYFDDYVKELKFMERSINLITELRVDEIVQPIYQVNAGQDQVPWDKVMQDPFKEYLIDHYQDMFRGFAAQVKVLTNYFDALFKQFAIKVREIFEKIHHFAKERLDYMVDLPRLASDLAEGAKDEVILQAFADSIQGVSEGLTNFKNQIAKAMSIRI